MQMTEDTYTNSLRKRMRVLLSPLRLVFFMAAIIISIVGNVVYISNGGGPEWLGLLSVIPIFAFAFWGSATDAKMRRLDRERREQAQ